MGVFINNILMGFESEQMASLGKSMIKCLQSSQKYYLIYFIMKTIAKMVDFKIGREIPFPLNIFV